MFELYASSMSARALPEKEPTAVKEDRFGGCAGLSWHSSRCCRHQNTSLVVVAVKHCYQQRGQMGLSIRPQNRLGPNIHSTKHVLLVETANLTVSAPTVLHVFGRIFFQKMTYLAKELRVPARIWLALAQHRKERHRIRIEPAFFHRMKLSFLFFTYSTENCYRSQCLSVCRRKWRRSTSKPLTLLRQYPMGHCRRDRNIV